MVRGRGGGGGEGYQGQPAGSCLRGWVPTAAIHGSNNGWCWPPAPAPVAGGLLNNSRAQTVAAALLPALSIVLSLHPVG